MRRSSPCKGYSGHFLTVGQAPASCSCASSPLFHWCNREWRARRQLPPHALVILELVAAGAAVLLLLGLWTPIAGAIVAVAELSLLLSHPQEPWPPIQLAMLGAALAMLGPGRWSVDARLFGRKHIPIPQP